MRRERRWSTAGVYPPGNWFAPPGSNQSSSGGNETESSAPEREELIKKIKKRIKTSEHANIAAMKRGLAQFHDTLDQKSVDDLREIAKAYRIHDRKGRSSLEGHTGSIKTDDGFVARIGLIDAAEQRGGEIRGRRVPEVANMDLC